jgi:cytochrome c553
MRWLSVLVSLVIICATNETRAAHPIVSGFERFHAQGEEPALGGQLLLGELGCTACHNAEKDALRFFHAKQAPNLDGVGSRVRAEHIRDFLSHPHETKPGTTMPDPFAGWAEAEKKDAVEALTHYLAQSGVVNDQRIHPSAVALGDALYHRLGCVACHDSQKPGAEKLATSVPLGNLGSKYTVGSLAAFLQDPSKARPSGRMPAMNLEGDEAKNLASFLLRDLKDIQVPANIKYALYEGSWSKLPEFAKLKPVSEGETFGFDLSFVPNKDNFALRFKGVINVPQDADYRFHVGSDDGSRLFVDGQKVVESDQIQGKTFKDGVAKLKAGRHDIILDYFEAQGGEELEAFIEGGGLGKQPLENVLVTEKKPDPQEKAKFVLDPSLATKGKELFASIGCASCHQSGGNQKVESKLKAPALASLKNSGGCLSENPAKGVPNFALNAVQGKALAEGINSVKPAAGKAVELKTEEKITRTLKTLNCVACHSRGGLGGIEEARNAHFQTTQKEMGDEGRIPPPLAGVGGKLKPAYLKQHLEVVFKERPYMLTRMPRFAGFPVTELAAQLSEDKPPEAKKVEHKFAEKELKHAGYTMVGAKGFSCIKCHTWGNVQATGIQSINMQRMHTRLNQEWFEAYLLAPAKFRPGTRMPASWPEGQVLLPKILDGKADTQIRAVWDYLSDGDKARQPLGLGRDPIELVAENEAIIYRNFIEGGGPRAIGVGYPEKVNLCYDANNLRLAMIWQGAFMDASKHWVDRGAGYQPPLGDNVLHLAAGVPLATLSDEKMQWPTLPPKQLGYQFEGYHLDKLRRPTFLYKYGEIEVSDEILPAGTTDQLAFRRTLTFKSAKPPEHIYYRAAVDDGIKLGDDGLYTMKANWFMKISGAKPVVRESNGKQELLVPVTFKDGTAKIVQEYIW